MNLKIREIEITDKDRWLKLWNGYLVFYKASLPESQTDLTWQRLFDPSFNVNGLVAELDGKVVGFTHFLFRPSTWSINDYCYLEDLFVDSEIRGKGAKTTPLWQNGLCTVAVREIPTPPSLNNRIHGLVFGRKVETEIHHTRDRSLAICLEPTYGTNITTTTSIMRRTLGCVMGPNYIC